MLTGDKKTVGEDVGEKLRLDEVLYRIVTRWKSWESRKINARKNRKR